MINLSDFPISSLYEIHITIDQPKPLFLDKLKDLCELLKVKLICVEGQNDLKHTMITKVVRSCETEMLKEIVNLKKIFKPYNPSRTKIEIPADINCNPNPSNYFESHLQVIVPNKLMIEKLEFICKHSNYHLSKNVYKKSEEGDIIMATLRTRKLNYIEFKKEIERFSELLLNNSFRIRKTELEFCIYDSNEIMDSKWLNLN